MHASKTSFVVVGSETEFIGVALRLFLRSFYCWCAQFDRQRSRLRRGRGASAGIDDPNDLLAEFFPEIESLSLTVFNRGEGGIAKSQKMVGGADTDVGLRARCERYDGPPVTCFVGNKSVSPALRASDAEPELVHRSMRG